MKAWLLSIVDLVRPWVSARPSPHRRHPTGRRVAQAPPRQGRSWAVGPASCEALEGRALLATSSVIPFATLTGQVAAANQPSQVVLHINAGEFRADQSPTVLLGFYVEPTAGSAVSPEITRVTGPNGQITPLPIANHGNTAADKLARQTHLFAPVIPLSTQAQDITLNVSTLNKQTGSYIVEAYLAGDVNGDGNVDASDLSALQVSYGSHQGQSNYNAAADFNGDGRVGCIDRKLTTINLGAHFVATAVTPAVAPSTSVPLIAATTEVSLYPAPAPASATVPATSTTIPIAVATPVAYATPVASASATSTGYVPVTLTPSSAIPVAATSTATPVVLTPVYPTAAASGSAAPASTASTTPVYLVAQPATTAAAPIYVYGQPVAATAAGATGTTATPGATLFGQIGSTAATGTSTPLPVYLYSNPRTS